MLYRYNISSKDLTIAAAVLECYCVRLNTGGPNEQVVNSNILKVKTWCLVFYVLRGLLASSYMLKQKTLLWADQIKVPCVSVQFIYKPEMTTKKIPAFLIPGFMKSGFFFLALAPRVALSPVVSVDSPTSQTRRWDVENESCSGLLDSAAPRHLPSYRLTPYHVNLPVKRWTRVKNNSADIWFDARLLVQMISAEACNVHGFSAVM